MWGRSLINFLDALAEEPALTHIPEPVIPEINFLDDPDNEWEMPDPAHGAPSYASEEYSEQQAEGELLLKFKSRKWRLNHLYYIIGKDPQTDKMKRILFKPNWAQQWLLDNMWYLNIILKARQLGFCVDPSTRVLTADLKWVPIGKLEEGQEIVATDEYTPGGRGKSRKMRTGTVQKVGRVFRHAYRIKFDDGREVVCTDQHPWLTKKIGTDAKWRSLSGKGNNVVGKINVGTKVRWITKPWDDDQSYEDGWMSGMLDGEGSMALPKSAGAEINVSQVQGKVFDRLENYFKDNDYSYRLEVDDGERKSKYGSKPVNKLCVSRMNEMFRLVGKTQPSRFIGRRFWEGKELPGKKTGIGWATVINIESVNRR